MNFVCRLIVLSSLLPLAAIAQPGCFAQWFCVTLDTATLNVFVYPIRPQPVVVTLTSGITNAPSTVELSPNAPVEIGQATSVMGFWHNLQVKWTPGRLNAIHNDSTRYAYPLNPAANYPVIQGHNGKLSHTGAARFAIDFAAPVGTPVYAARAGQIIDLNASSNTGGPDPAFADKANFVAILHQDNTVAEYYHLKQQGVTVALGQSVETGEQIGYSGNTGFSTEPHLHFAVYQALPDGNYQTLPVTFYSHAD